MTREEWLRTVAHCRADAAASVRSRAMGLSTRANTLDASSAELVDDAETEKARLKAEEETP